MSKNSTVKLGNVPFSSSSNTRYKVGKSATFSKTFSGCTYIRLSGFVKIQATPSEVSGYNFIEITEADGMAVRGFIQSIDYINNLTTQISFKIDGWETWKGSVTFKKSYIERLSAGTGGSEYTYTLPEPFSSDKYTCYAQTQYKITDYKFIIASLHNTSEQLYTDASNIGPDTVGASHYHKIDFLSSAGGTFLNGIYHGCNFIVADTAEQAKKYISALVMAGYESSILSVFSVPSALITANSTKTTNCQYYTYRTIADFQGEKKESTCTVLSDSSIMCFVTEVTAPAITHASQCDYKKIKNAPYTFLRVTTPSGATVDFDYKDFTSDTPRFGIYGAIGFNSELLLVPCDYQGIQYNFSKAISIQCNQTGMFSSSTFASWAEAQQLKYISSAISTATSGISAAVSQNYAGMASTAITAGLAAVNYSNDYSIASKTSISAVGNVSNSDFSFCHPESSCFRFCCMSLRPAEAENLSSYIDNFGYSVSMYDVPNTNFIDDDCYIKTNNVQLEVNCPDSYASEIRMLFNSGCKFI